MKAQERTHQRQEKEGAPSVTRPHSKKKRRVPGLLRIKQSSTLNKEGVTVKGGCERDYPSKHNFGLQGSL